MQDRNKCSQGISVQLKFTRSRSTRLRCTQHAFFAYIHWIFGFHHAFGKSVIIMPRILNIGLINCSVNVTEVYYRRVWKAQYFERLVLQPTTGIFFALLGTEGQVKSLTKKFVLLARNTRFKKPFPVFPNSRSVTLKERDTVNNTANLST